ncbi:MAG: hypothetical protein MUP98_04785 [Candidatus Aminicenantes bacterium]|nr:hypothetical protein [Candidatus Aminicenantes bacterium]
MKETILKPPSKTSFNKIFNEESKKIYRRAELYALINEYKKAKKLPDVTTKLIIDIIRDKGSLKIITMPSEGPYPSIIRYAWGLKVSPFELGLSLKNKSYFTHSTAVFLHGLTDQIPQTLYVNVEQSLKPRSSETLTQRAIDQAFKASQRSSRYVFIYERNRFVILSGKNTGQYGVITLPPENQIRTTSIERTLVDISVRPVYGGGIHQVLSAFRAALGRLSINRLVDALNSLDYVYPYHQALGFYLERAGFPKEKLQSLSSKGIKFNFYLAHGMHNPAFDPSWRIYYPKNL